MFRFAVVLRSCYCLVRLSADAFPQLSKCNAAHQVHVRITNRASCRRVCAHMGIDPRRGFNLELTLGEASWKSEIKELEYAYPQQSRFRSSQLPARVPGTRGFP
jgi:hypothetical protein